MGRKGPTESATLYSVGTRKRGNDGNMWSIIADKNGTRRWKRNVSSSTRKNKTRKVENIRSHNERRNTVTLKELERKRRKYHVSAYGSKKEIALGLWRVQGRAMQDEDVQTILPLLPDEAKKRAERLLSGRKKHQILDYKGMWKPQPKPLNKMDRKELIKNLQQFRDSWERITTRNADLDDSRLEEESTANLRELIRFYYSDEAKQLAGDWLR